MGGETRERGDERREVDWRLCPTQQEKEKPKMLLSPLASRAALSDI